MVQRWSPCESLYIILSVFDSLNNRAFVYLSDKSICLFFLGVDLPTITIPYSTGYLKSGQILSGLVIPQKYPSKDEIFSNTALCLMDSYHQLRALGLASSQEAQYNPEDDLEEKSKLTPFAKMLLNEKKKVSVEKAMKEIEMEKYLGPNSDSKKMIEELFINTPSHVLPPIETISKKFLASFLIQETFE